MKSKDSNTIGLSAVLISMTLVACLIVCPISFLGYLFFRNAEIERKHAMEIAELKSREFELIKEQVNVEKARLDNEIAQARAEAKRAELEEREKEKLKAISDWQPEPNTNTFGTKIVTRWKFCEKDSKDWPLMVNEVLVVVAEKEIYLETKSGDRYALNHIAEKDTEKYKSVEEIRRRGEFNQLLSLEKLQSIGRALMDK